MNGETAAESLWQRFFRGLWPGGGLYQAWMLLLSMPLLAGLLAYGYQLYHGLRVTGLSDQVSWGLYIGNFIFLVGVAAAAVVLVIPAWLFQRPWMARMTLFGECLAITAVLMSLLFVFVDLGQPLRAWHALPLLGSLHFPASIMAWDMVVLVAYLVLNLGMLVSGLRRHHRRQPPSRRRLLPWMVLAIIVGLSIHTVTAFLLAGLPARPFWHTALLAPRFIASAVAAGSALMIWAFHLLNRHRLFRVDRAVFGDLAMFMLFALLLQFFFLFSELFVHFYPPGRHGDGATYLFLGLPGGHDLVHGIRLALGMGFVATLLLLLPAVREPGFGLLSVSLLAVAGIWFEKGVGLVVPGFVPTPLGEVVVYRATAVEISITAGIWAFGLLVFTLLSRGVASVLTSVETTTEK